MDTLSDLINPIAFPIALAVYLIPSIIGWNKRNADGIVATNVILGWTLIGWVIALIWALSDSKPQAYKIPPKQDSKIDSVKKLKDLLDSGALTEHEFNKEKQKILNP